MNNMKQFVVERIKGFLACLVIALVAQQIGHIFPQIGGALFAILLGILLGNTLLNRESLNKGVKFSESKLLEYSIALTGLTLNIQDVLGVGVSGVLFIACQMTLTITCAYYLGRLFGFNRKFSLLMGAGNAVCGSSAIGTVTPVVGAEDKDKGISITVVNLTGTILMVLLPLLTGWLYQHETMHTSALIGGVLQSIGQVIASAKLVNDEVTQYATIFKIVRIIFLVVVALVFSKMNTEETGPLFKRSAENKKGTSVGIPWFIKVFFVCSLAITLLPIPEIVSIAAKQISSQFEIIALAGIGMRVKFKDLIKEGPKALALGGTIGTIQVIAAILFIRLFLG